MTRAARRPPPEGRFDRRLLAPMMLGAVLNPVNSSIISVALVPIAAAFGAPLSQTAWLIASLYLATSIGQPLVGRLVDTFGPRALFLVGAVLTMAAGLLGALAPGIGTLVAARVVLGFGTCAGYPAAMSLIRSEGERTGVHSPAGVLAALSVATQTIAVVGPTLGGLLIELGGWRMTFALNVPLGAAALVLGALVLPRAAALGVVRPPRLRLDLLGIGLFATTLVCLLLFLMELSPQTLWLLIAVVVAGALFVWRELRCEEPFLDVRLFAGNVPLLVTYARAVLAATVSYCYLYGYTQWLEDGRGLSPTAAGLVLLPTFALGIAVAAVFGRRPRVRGKLLAGAAAQVVAAALLLVTGADSPLWFLVAVALVFGVPQGLVNLAIQNTLYHQADSARLGASSGLLRTFMYIGAMLASSATGALFHTSAGTAGMHGLAVVMIVAAASLLAVTIVDGSLRRVDRRIAPRS